VSGNVTGPQGLSGSGLDSGGLDSGGLESGGLDGSGLESGGLDGSGLHRGGLDGGGLELRGIELSGFVRRRFARNPVDRARDVIAARLEGEFPGWKLAHGLYGWTATRAADGRVIRADSAPGLAVLVQIAGRC
jgi:hypothetical protein